MVRDSLFAEMTWTTVASLVPGGSTTVAAGLNGWGVGDQLNAYKFSSTSGLVDRNYAELVRQTESHISTLAREAWLPSIRRQSCTSNRSRIR
jgi:hypothetical protein